MLNILVADVKMKKGYTPKLYGAMMSRSRSSKVLLFVSLLAASHVETGTAFVGFTPGSRFCATRAVLAENHSMTVYMTASSTARSPMSRVRAVPRKVFSLFRRAPPPSLENDVFPREELGGVIVTNGKETRLKSFEIPVLTRPRVSFDADTGTYVAPCSSSLEPVVKKEEDKTSKWTILKNALYSTADVVVSASSRIRSLSSRTSYPLEHDGVAFGYGDITERDPLSFSSPSFLQHSTSSRAASTPGATLLRQYQRSIQNQNDSTTLQSAEEETKLGRETKKKLFNTNESNGFVAVKDGLYSTLDLFSSNHANNQNHHDNEIMDSRSFKPLFKPSRNQDETIKAITSLLPQLSSSNPIEKVVAQFQVAALEREQARRLASQRREEFFLKSKDVMYAIGNGVEMTFQYVTQVFPTQLMETAQSTRLFLEGVMSSLRTVPKRVDDTILECQSFPSKVQQKVKEVQESVQETQRITRVVWNDITNIPQAVSTKVRETRASVQNVQLRVQDATYDAKVWMGAEKRKPRPPKTPPPPPPTKTEIALETARNVAGTTANAAWIVGKGVVRLGVGSVKLAWSAFSPPIAKSDVGAVEKKSRWSKPEIARNGYDGSGKSMPTTGKMKASTKVVLAAQAEAERQRLLSVAKKTARDEATNLGSTDVKKKERSSLTEVVDPVLEKDARLAQETATETPNPPDFDTWRAKIESGERSVEIDRALQKAKKAAARSAAAAAELDDSKNMVNPSGRDWQ